jgi:cell wall assembly regulator SMI1
MGKAKSVPIRRFLHLDGSWSNVTTADGKVVLHSGNEGATVPYFGNVKEESFAPASGRTVKAEIERLVADLAQRGFIEVLPTKKPAGEKKIDGLWRRLENWFYEHVPAFCRWPLAPGASEADVQAFEKTIGAKLPDDVRRSYLRHNGSAGVDLLDVVGEGKWSTLSGVAASWKHFQESRPVLEEAGFLEPPLGPMKEVHISPGWIPIGDNQGGDHLCVDLDPAEGGTVGQLFSYWHEYGAWRFVAPSITAFLEHLLKHLDAGRYAINDRGQLASVAGPEPESVEPTQEYFLEGAKFAAAKLKKKKPKDEPSSKEKIAKLTAWLEEAPDDLDIPNLLAWELATSSDPDCRDGERAVEIALETCQRDKGRDPHFLATLAAAWAEYGQFELAVKYARLALERNPHDAEFVAETTERLNLYLAGKPFHE